MELYAFKELVMQEFGQRFEHATPENVREFMDRIQRDVLAPSTKGRIILEEQASTYEEIIKDFFVKVLDMPKDEALMMLWLLSFELIFSAIELQQAERFGPMFRDFDQYGY